MSFLMSFLMSILMSIVILKNTNTIMKNYLQLVIISIIGCFICQIGSSQVDCKDEVVISVTPWGEDISLTLDMVLENPSTNNYVITPSTISCDDIGSSILVAVINTNTGDQCLSTVSVVDKTPPVAIVTATTSLRLNSSSETLLYAQDIDNGSYDGCTGIKLEIRKVTDACDVAGNTTFDNDVDADDSASDDDNGSYVSFCEEESGEIVLVVLRVWDDANRDGVIGNSGDNYNDVMGEVIIDGGGDDSNSANVRLWMEDAAGDQGDNVCVGLVASGISEIHSFQGSITWDPAVLSYSNISDIVLPDFDNSTVNDAMADVDGLLPFVWFDVTGSTSFSAPDKAVLFSVCFDVLGQVGDVSEVNIGNSPVKVEIGNGEEILDADYTGGLFVVRSEFDCGNENLLSLNSVGETENGFWDGHLDYNTAFSSTPNFDIYFPEPILEIENVQNIEPENLQKIFDDISTNNYNEGITYAFPYVITASSNGDYIPSSVSPVYNNFSSTYEDIIINEDNQTKIIRTWTVIDWCTTETISFTQIIKSISEAVAGAPTPYCVNLSTALLDNGEIELWACDFDQGSFDDETEQEDLRFTFGSTPPENDPTFDDSSNCSSRIFTCDDYLNLKDGFTEVTMYVWDEDGNSDFCLVLLRLVDNQGSCDGATDCSILACNDKINVSVGDNGQAKLFAETFLEGGGCDYSNLIIRVINTETENEIASGVGEIVLSTLGTFAYTITDPETGNSCWGQIIVEDKTSSSACENPCIFDGCDPITGIIWPGDFTNDGEEAKADCGSVLPTQNSLTNLATNTGEPAWNVDETNCEILLGFSLKSDTFKFADNCMKIINSWSVINWCVYDPSSNNNDGMYNHTQVIRFSENGEDCESIDTECGTLVCNDNIVTTHDNKEGVKLSIEAFLEGDYDDCNLQIVILEAFDADPIAEGNESIFIDFYGTFMYVITDLETGNSCWGEIVIEDIGGSNGCEDPCPFAGCDSENGITWPADYTGAGNAPNVECGQKLESQDPITSFSTNTGEPSWDIDQTNCPNVIGFAFDEDIFYGEEGYCAKILRHWSVLNWCVFDPSQQNDEGIYEHTQIILVDLPSDDCEQDSSEDCDVLICLDKITVVQKDGEELSLYAADFLKSDCDASEFLLEIGTDSDILISGTGSVVMPSSLNGTYNYAITDPKTGNSCWGQITFSAENAEEQFICDELPWTAEVTDCEGGHTLEDDVEWPDNITIADYRISPRQLQNLGSIDKRNTTPDLLGNSTYSTSYQDIVDELNPTSLYLTRRWNLTRSDIQNMSWSYDQKIAIDISDFSNLVTVNTIGNRGIPNVAIDENTVTDQDGIAYVSDTGELNPSYEDELINGLNIKDLVLMQKHVLGTDMLDPMNLLAGDSNQDGLLSVIDLVEVRKIILGLPTLLTEPWIFLDRTETIEEGLRPYSHQVGLKLGDVDDSVSLNGQTVDIESNQMVFEDQELISGESYQISFYLQDAVNLVGVELRLELDASIQVNDITSNLYDVNDSTWTLSENGIFNLLMFNEDTSPVQTNGIQGSSIFTLEIFALEDLNLSSALKPFNVDPFRFSYTLSENLELKHIEIQSVGEIISDVNSLDESSTISVYPNPTSDFVQIDFSENLKGQDYTFEIFNSIGQSVQKVSNLEQIELNHLPAGTYIYKVQLDKAFKTGKLMFIK